MGGEVPRPTEGSIDLIGVVRAARAGDEQAWGQLVGEYGPRVFALARSRLRDPDKAEEVMQSVFATIAIKLRDGAYDEHGKFEPWLFRIAMNRIRDAVRKAKREASPDRLRLAAVSDESSAEDQVRVAPQAIGRLRDALGGLSKPDREIIELRYHAGMTFKQIAELLGEPIGTLLARHHRALRKLRGTLEEDGGVSFEGADLPRPAGEAG